MAQRLSSEERARIEVMAAAGVGVAETARRLGRHRSTVYRELVRTSSGGYDAHEAQTAADRRARRPKRPKLACDAVLAAATLSRLRDRRSPHSASAELRAEGHQVCAETIYRACYDHTAAHGLARGIVAAAAAALPTAQSPGPPRTKAQPAGRFPADLAASRSRGGPPRGRPLRRRPDHRQEQPLSRGHPHPPRGSAARPCSPRCPAATTLPASPPRSPRRWPASPDTSSSP